MKAMRLQNYSFQDPSGWWMGEKLDGVRGCWNGHEMTTIEGNPIACPAWFSNQLPAGVPLEGELWMGYHTLRAMAAAVRRKKPLDAEWKRVTFRIFDAPAASGSFESRLEFARKVLSGNPVASLIEHIRCRNPWHLDEYFEQLVSAGAEGAVLRAAGSPYIEGRSKLALKYKPFEDAEAVMCGAVRGEDGRLDSVLLDWNGISFKLGNLPPELITTPPVIGAKITFRFCGKEESGRPRCAKFVEVRDYE